MANIVGNGFRDWVIDQIEVRQRILGEQYHYDDAFVKYVSKTPWIRMASSVDLDVTQNPNLLGLVGDYPINGPSLAKANVLFGGTLEVEDNTLNGNPTLTPLGLKYGVNTEATIINSNSYGYGGNEWGIRPMPGITSVKIDNLNNGAIRKAVVNFSCYNKDQFTLLETLYMRVGYYILVEWGHTMYLDSLSNPIIPTIESRRNFSTPAFDSFFNNKSADHILENIEQETHDSSGNYDGFLGRITNFNWSFDKGTYNCSITVYSPGDVIESLKSNKAFSTQNIDISTANSGSNPVDSSSTTSPYTFIANRNSNEIASSLYQWYLYLDKNNKDNAKTSNETVAPLEFYRWSDGNGDKEYFVTLGRLLRMVQSKLLLYDTSKNPIISIDSDYSTNYCARFPEQLSCNYNVCYIPFEISDGTSTWTSSSLNKIVGKNGYAYKNYVGKMMHILVNFDFIIETMNSNIDANNRLNIRDFIQAILNGIQQSIGGINDFQVGYDYVTNRLKIYDNGPLLSEQLVTGKRPKIAKFKSYGVEKGSQGSFLLNISLESSLSKEMSSMIACGAQENGNQVGENATAFSLLNKGLKDRVNPSKLDAYTANNQSKNNTTDNDVFINSKKTLFNLVKQRYTKGGSSIDLQSAYGVNTDFANYYLGLATKQENTPGKFFIPFNLTLEMDGLSGMRIYDVFSISNEILPPQYTENLQFVIKGLNHSIDKGGWTTTLDSFTYNQFESTSPKPVVNIPTPTFGDGMPTSGGDSGGGSTGPVRYAPVKENAPLRLELKRIKEVVFDNGTEKLQGTLGELYFVDDNRSRTKLGYTMELPWRNNKNSVSCIVPNEPDSAYGVAKVSGHHKYGKAFHVTPNPPGRAEIMMHRGINEKWTKGCILPIREYEVIPGAFMVEGGTVIQEKTGKSFSDKKQKSIEFTAEVWDKIPEDYFKMRILGVPENLMKSYGKSYSNTSKNWDPDPPKKP